MVESPVRIPSNLYTITDIKTNQSIDLRSVGCIEVYFPHGHTITLTADDVYKILKGLTEKMDKVEDDAK